MKSMFRLMTIMALALPVAATGQQPVLTEWVENNPGGDPTKIALGYPVPIPVDTPLPFDGFRSWAGLHVRHQDLALTTPWVHPSEVGQTRLGRTIWAYRLGDADRLTPWGLPEPATLTNGGTHAREWQSPETVTGILELIATHEADRHLYDYLREHVNMIVIPTLNIDGFLQTQRYPSLNWLGTDPRTPDHSPRDGRMRRKNLLQADQNLNTLADHLNGVDLNRNNLPFWAMGGFQSSPDAEDLQYYGAEPQSEPEVHALDTAAALGPADRLRLYTDVHSFSQRHFWGRSDNFRLAVQTEEVLELFTGHHAAFLAGKKYFYLGRFSPALPVNEGIGTTAEYFTHLYEVPSWTLEIEPSQGEPWHAPLPGGGADYGGMHVNGHDGFILPESEITRVREQLAQTFAAVYYRQAGPPHVQAVRFVDRATGAVVFEAEWDVVDEQQRQRFVNQVQPIVLGRQYDLWIGFSKPMRWIENGLPAPFQGQDPDLLDVVVEALIDDQAVEMQKSGAGWLSAPGGAPGGFMDYVFDAYRLEVLYPDSDANTALLDKSGEVTLVLGARDMVNLALDADPGTVVDWADGHWANYEDSNGVQTDFGGHDSTLRFSVTSEVLPEPFVIEPGITAAWYDPEHTGEGFIIEVLADGRAVLYWFTYDAEGNQDWYIAVGEVRGNRMVFPELLRASGGVFGPDFDPELIEYEVAGSARFIWSGCDHGFMDWHIGHRRGRQALVRLSRLMGAECGLPIMGPIGEEALLSGAWFDLTHAGEGYTVEVLVDGRVLVYWFSFGPDGSRRWFFGVGAIEGGKLVFDEMLTTRGGVFGDGFDPGEVEYLPWGTLELDIGCDGGTATYAGTEEGFGSGVLHVQKLTNIPGVSCAD